MILDDKTDIWPECGTELEVPHNICTAGSLYNRWPCVRSVTTSLEPWHYDLLHPGGARRVSKQAYGWFCNLDSGLVYESVPLARLTKHLNEDHNYVQDYMHFAYNAYNHTSNHKKCHCLELSLIQGSFLDRCTCNLAMQVHFNQVPSKTTSFPDFDMGYMAHNLNKWTVWCMTMPWK